MHHTNLWDLSQQGYKPKYLLRDFVVEFLFYAAKGIEKASIRQQLCTIFSSKGIIFFLFLAANHNKDYSVVKTFRFLPSSLTGTFFATGWFFENGYVPTNWFRSFILLFFDSLWFLTAKVHLCCSKLRYRFHFFRFYYCKVSESRAQYKMKE